MADLPKAKARGVNEPGLVTPNTMKLRPGQKARIVETWIRECVMVNGHAQIREYLESVKRKRVRPEVPEGVGDWQI